jgi:glycosyltransferase involved in cell wall biosynthesis
MSKPVISVLMSVFNGEDWLEQSILSVICQEFSDFEFIIVNDGSTDKSLNIINNLASRDSRLRVFDKPNTGLADSLNYGIEVAKGEWIARIDADDLWEPHRLCKQYELARSNSRLVLIGSGFTIIDRNGKFERSISPPLSHNSLLKSLTIRGINPFAHSSVLYSKEAVKSLGGYRVRLKRSQDYDLWLRLSDIGNMAYIQEPLVKLRKHESQISNEEAGERQLVDGHIAITSYWLRHNGSSDPVSTDFSDEIFDGFRAWLKEELNLEGVLEEYRLLKQVKSEIVGLDTFQLIAYFLGLCLKKPGFLLRYLGKKLYGSRLPKRLAREWHRLSTNHKNHQNAGVDSSLISG